MILWNNLNVRSSSRISSENHNTLSQLKLLTTRVPKSNGYRLNQIRMICAYCRPVKTQQMLNNFSCKAVTWTAFQIRVRACISLIKVLTKSRWALVVSKTFRTKPMLRQVLHTVKRKLRSKQTRLEHNLMDRTSTSRPLRKANQRMLFHSFKNNRELNKPSSLRISLSTRKTYWRHSAATRFTANSWRYSKKERSSTDKWNLKMNSNLTDFNKVPKAKRTKAWVKSTSKTSLDEAATCLLKAHNL